MAIDHDCSRQYIVRMASGIRRFRPLHPAPLALGPPCLSDPLAVQS